MIKSLYEQYLECDAVWVPGYVWTEADVKSLQKIFGAMQYARRKADCYEAALKRIETMEVKDTNHQCGALQAHYARAALETYYDSEAKE